MRNSSYFSTFGPAEIRLTDAQRDALVAQFRQLPYPQQGPFAPYVAQAIDIAAKVLGPSQRRTLRAVKTAGVILVSNLPRDLGVTHGPRDPEAAIRAKATDISEGVLTGVVGLVGTPYAVLREGAGLIGNVAAKQGRTTSLTGLGAVPLDLHIENGFGRTFTPDRSPKGLALIGVCREPGGPVATPIASGAEAVRRLAWKHQVALTRSEFGIREPERWRRGDEPVVRTTPVVLGGLADPKLVIATYGDMLQARTRRAAAALEAFKAALEAVTVDLVIEPGVIALIDNEAMLHGRRGYDAAFTEAGEPYRWLQRLFWTDDLDGFGGWSLGDEPLVDPHRPD